MRYARAIGRLKGFGHGEHGGVLVEFAIVVALFVFMFFTLIDFGRLAYTIVLAENASAIAVRTAVVRPPACAGVPDRYYVRGGATPPPRFGSSCGALAGTCALVPEVSCAGDSTNPTAQEIWTRVQNLLPRNTQISDLQFTYTFDEKLGFLGGPYVPRVTFEMNLPAFQFTSPLGALANAAGATGSTLGSEVNLQSFSESLPGEDLANGEDG